LLYVGCSVCEGIKPCLEVFQTIHLLSFSFLKPRPNETPKDGALIKETLHHLLRNKSLRQLRIWGNLFSFLDKEKKGNLIDQLKVTDSFELLEANKDDLGNLMIK
jgi:hypothetical protein